jgi:hypothetical protein
VRYVRSYLDEEDIEFFWEIDDDGWVQRHVEIVRATGDVRGAASLSESNQARDNGSLPEYQGRFGGIAEGNLADWDRDRPSDDLSAEQYQAVWRHARDQLGGSPWSRLAESGPPA